MCLERRWASFFAAIICAAALGVRLGQCHVVLSNALYCNQRGAVALLKACMGGKSETVSGMGVMMLLRSPVSRYAVV